MLQAVSLSENNQRGDAVSDYFHTSKSTFVCGGCELKSRSSHADLPGMLMGHDIQRVTVAFCWLNPEQCCDLKLPEYETPQSAGMDIGAAIDQPVEISPGGIVLIPSGFGVALPPGFELQVRPRSGLAIKHGITVINAPGTIVADYRGEIKVGLINLGPNPYVVHRGDRIAQLILAPVCRMLLQPVEQLDDTRRGAGGFGHTGR